MRKETGAAGLAKAVAAPQWIVVAFLAVAAAMAGYGWSLVALLTVTVASMLLAAGVWRLYVHWRPHPGIATSMLLGLVLGAAAAALSFGAVSADREISPHFGGSLLQDAGGKAIGAGVKAGADALKTGTAIDIVTIPHRAVAGLAGGLLVVGVLAAVFLGAVSLPIVTGLFGGLAAAMQARRAWRNSMASANAQPSEAAAN
jgi:hypothetical protein